MSLHALDLLKNLGYVGDIPPNCTNSPRL